MVDYSVLVTFVESVLILIFCFLEQTTVFTPGITTLHRTHNADVHIDRGVYARPVTFTCFTKRRMFVAFLVVLEQFAAFKISALTCVDNSALEK